MASWARPSLQGSGLGYAAAAVDAGRDFQALPLSAFCTCCVLWVLWVGCADQGFGLLELESTPLVLPRSAVGSGFIREGSLL